MYQSHIKYVLYKIYMFRIKDFVKILLRTPISFLLNKYHLKELSKDFRTFENLLYVYIYTFIYKL